MHTYVHTHDPWEGRKAGRSQAQLLTVLLGEMPGQTTQRRGLTLGALALLISQTSNSAFTLAVFFLKENNSHCLGGNTGPSATPFGVR